MTIFETLKHHPEMYYFILLGRLLLACLLGGIIGYEREQTHRPAGFRTHILVCIGSALVMVTSEFIFKQYSGHTNADPARLGAQVISGIGFLGAGTIIREGFNVKGLTTAASLWAVSCVGIAVGIGFYEGAIAATILIYLTLITLKKIEDHIAKKSNYRYIYVKSENIVGRIGIFSAAIEKHQLRIKSIDFISGEKGEALLMRFLVAVPADYNNSSLISELQGIDGVKKVYDE